MTGFPRQAFFLGGDVHGLQAAAALRTLPGCCSSFRGIYLQDGCLVTLPFHGKSPVKQGGAF